MPDLSHSRIGEAASICCIPDAGSSTAATSEENTARSPGFRISSAQSTGRTQCTAHHVERTDEGANDTVLHITYDDRFARVDDKWLIERRELRVRWTEIRQVAAL